MYDEHRDNPLIAALVKRIEQLEKELAEVKTKQTINNYYYNTYSYPYTQYPYNPYRNIQYSGVVNGISLINGQ